MMHDMMRLAVCGVCICARACLCVYVRILFFLSVHENQRTLEVEINQFEYFLFKKRA